jgi:hypothetical protein
MIELFSKVNWGAVGGVATGLLALWKTIEILIGGFDWLWSRWQKSREEQLQLDYPDLYERLDFSKRWLLDDEELFSFSQP